MRVLVAIAAIAFLGAGPDVFAQSKDNNTQSDNKGFPNTLQPVNPVKYYGPRKAKKKKKRAPVTYDARDEYFDRVERACREYEKRDRNNSMQGESDEQLKPPFFGHKKAPKIRPIEKRKYCKICGIRH